MTEKFKVGDEVFVVFGSALGEKNHARDRIARKHKGTGNFILEKRRCEQFRPDGWPAGHGYERPRIMPITPETEAAARSSGARDRIAVALSKIGNAPLKRLPAERLEGIADFMEEVIRDANAAKAD